MKIVLEIYTFITLHTYYVFNTCQTLHNVLELEALDQALLCSKKSPRSTVACRTVVMHKAEIGSSSGVASG